MTPESAAFRGEILGFPHELFLASGAGDGDFSFAPGDTDGLAALGTVEVAVVPVLQTVEKQEEGPVLLVALVGIPGEGPEDGPDHQAVAEKPENGAHNGPGEEGGEDACKQTEPQDHHIQSVRTVAAGHKVTEPRA